MSRPLAFGSAGAAIHWARFRIGGRTGLFHLITAVEPPLAGSACGRMMFISSQVAYSGSADDLPEADVCRVCRNSGRDH